MSVSNYEGPPAMVIPYLSAEKLALLAAGVLGMDWLSSSVPFSAEFGSLFARANLLSSAFARSSEAKSQGTNKNQITA